MALKYYPRRDQWENSTGTNTVKVCDGSYTALSWSWWEYAKSYNGLVVFNNYSYSPSTSKHQSDTRSLFRDLGIEIDITVEAPDGLQKLETAIEHYENKIDELHDLIESPRSHKRKNAERLSEINNYYQKIYDIEKILMRVN